MKKAVLLVFILFVSLSCDEDPHIDCSLVDCFPGDVVELEFLSNNVNVLESDPSTEITVIQNGASLDFTINPNTNITRIILSLNDPLTISVGDQQFTMGISSGLTENECCSILRVTELRIGDQVICQDEGCDEVLSIDLDK